MFCDMSYKINIDLFFKSQSCFCRVFLRPSREGIGSGLQFFICFVRNLDLALPSAVDQPFPVFIDLPNSIAATICVYQCVSVEKAKR